MAKDDKKIKEAAPAALVKTTAGLKTVLVQPRVSEKSGQLSEQGKYVFEVATAANKIEVKKAIEKSYNVSVTQVNMIRMASRTRSFGRTVGKTGAFKKAIVTLKKGDKIEGITETV